VLNVGQREQIRKVVPCAIAVRCVALVDNQFTVRQLRIHDANHNGPQLIAEPSATRSFQYQCSHLQIFCQTPRTLFPTEYRRIQSLIRDARTRQLSQKAICAGVGSDCDSNHLLAIEANKPTLSR